MRLAISLAKDIAICINLYSTFLSFSPLFFVHLYFFHFARLPIHDNDKQLLLLPRPSPLRLRCGCAGASSKSRPAPGSVMSFASQRRIPSQAAPRRLLITTMRVWLRFGWTTGKSSTTVFIQVNEQHQQNQKQKTK